MKTKLKYEEDFVNIAGSFGVSQHWLKGAVPDFYRNRSCALAALVNVLYYESGDLRRRGSTRKEARRLLEELYRRIPPRPWGIPFFRTLRRKFITFAGELGLDLDYVPFRGSFTEGEVGEFLKKALGEDHPVLLLTWNHPMKDFHNHWVTITGYDDATATLTVSNWGRRREYSLREYLKGTGMYRGMGYFKKK